MSGAGCEWSFRADKKAASRCQTESTAHLERSGRTARAAPSRGAPTWRSALVALHGLRQPAGARPAVRPIYDSRCVWWRRSHGAVRFASLHFGLTQVLPAQTTMVRRLHHIVLRCSGEYRSCLLPDARQPPHRSRCLAREWDGCHEGVTLEIVPGAAPALVAFDPTHRRCCAVVDMHRAGLAPCSRAGSADRPAQRDDRRAAVSRPGSPDPCHRGTVCARRATGTDLRGRCRAWGGAGTGQRFLDRPYAGPRGNWRWLRRSQRLVVYPWSRRVSELSRA